MEAVSNGPAPELHTDSEEEEPEEAEEPIEPGDRIFAIGLVPAPAEILATSSVSQRLAEAFKPSTPSGRSVPEYLKEFNSVFSKESFDALPESKKWDHAVKLIPGEKASNCKVSPLAPTEQKELDQFLKENLETGQIHPYKSPMASLVFFIKKKDGTLWVVQDYWALNAMTVKNKYPLPLISKLINKLRGAKYFTKLDVLWGFNNVQMKEGDEWKAAFQTNRGLFKPLVMFFGLCNSLATFQTMMDDIFDDLITEGVVVVYLDDILIFTETLKEHQRVTWRVMELLQKNNLFLKPEKCKFKKTEVEYLGVIISQNSVKMDPVKVAGVMEWPTPSNRKEVQSFLGFTNFYCRFIQGFSHLAHPLFDLTWKDMEWRWGAEEQSEFDSLKERITTAPILALPDNSQPFRIEADSSDFATGTVLSQHSPEDNKWHPVAFLSKSLSPVEQNYEIHDKEMLAIVRALEEWRHFVEGAEHRCEIWMDHKNLQYFMTAKKLNRRQARWSLLLARFDFIMHHRPGKSMGKTDTLSRWSDHRTGSEDNDNMVLLTLNFFVVRALEGLEAAGEEQGILKDIQKGTHDGEKEEPVARAARELLLGYAPLRLMFPPIFLCHLCIFLLIVASPRQSALAAPIPESDDHVM